MSESRPKHHQTPTSTYKAIRSRYRPGRSRWFFASVAVHVVAVVALVYLTPVREAVQEVVERTRPERRMSARGIQDLAEAIERSSADQVADDARSLERMFERIEEIREAMSERYRDFERRQRANAPRDALRDMQRALESMQSAAGAIAEGEAAEAVDRRQAIAEHSQYRAEAKLGMTPFDVSEATELQQDALQAHLEAKSAHERRREMEPQFESRQEEFQQVQRETERLQQELEQARDQDTDEEEIEQAEERYSEQLTRLEEASQEFEQHRHEAKEVRREAVQDQQHAAQLQQDAISALEASIERHSEEADAALAESRFEPIEIQSPRPVDEVGRRIPELYETARELEDRIAESFQEIRAMDLAIVRDMTLEAARHDIDVVRPVRPDLDHSLLTESVRTDRRFEEHQREVEKALRETTSMVNLARRMLTMSTQSVEHRTFGTDLSTVALEEGLTEQELQLLIRELASEEMSGRHADLADIMAALAQAEAADAEGEDVDVEGDEMVAAVPSVDYEDLTDAQHEEGPMPYLGDEGVEEGDEPHLSPDTPMVGARKITSDGVPTRWMYVDSWYTIGPFPNPDRVNIDREFPPDSVVDLDASYIGKDGKIVRWQFVQSTRPLLRPADADEYAIYYAYTEIYSDKPRDVLIAVGSDDRGILKINDTLVWESPRHLKGWEIDEAWRRIHLREGINRVLYRVENGWLNIAFSLSIRLDE